MNVIGKKLVKRFENGCWFSCQMCGRCCKGLKEGDVFLYRDDIIRLKNFLNKTKKISLKEFAQKYLKIIDDSFYWKELGAERGKNYKFKSLGFKFIGDDEHCEFLNDKNECNVHNARPFQCIAFPVF